MGHETNSPDTVQPVLPSTLVRPNDDLIDSAGLGSVGTDPMPAEPRPITISPPSSLATPTLPPTRHVTLPTAARTVPIAAPQADMSTPAAGMPRLETPAPPTLADSGSPALRVADPEFHEVVQAVVEQETSRFVIDGPPHPMAHLMPERTKPTEAQIRAAELRAANKKKARRAKVLVVAAAVALGVFAGPPFAAWVVDAVNESGSTTVESNDTPTGTETPDDNSGVDDLLEDYDTRTSVVTDDTDG